jgi:UDP-glucuronate 4-epimerase
MRVLLTGAAGFIGSHVTERLLARGDTVLGIDNFNNFYDPAIKRRNLAPSLAHPEFSLVEGDIVVPSVLDRAFEALRPDRVVHLAAWAGVRPSIDRPMLYQRVNIEGTTRILEACRRHGVDRFVFASSSSVYGDRPPKTSGDTSVLASGQASGDTSGQASGQASGDTSGQASGQDPADAAPFRETDNVDCPVSPYAATKKSGELLCHTWHHLFGLHTHCLRFFTVYGPRQRPEMAIHKFARLIAAGQPVPMFGDGSTSRDYTYVDDIVDGVLASIDRCEGYRIYNLGESKTMRLDALIALLAQALGRPATIEHKPLQPGDVTRTFADVSRARAELGYTPKVSMPEGIARFVEWFRAQPA